MDGGAISKPGEISWCNETRNGRRGCTSLREPAGRRTVILNRSGSGLQGHLLVTAARQAPASMALAGPRRQLLGYRLIECFRAGRRGPGAFLPAALALEMGVRP